MMKQLALVGIIILFASCTSTKSASKNVSKNQAQILKDYNTFVINEISTDKTYGLTSKNPVEVGGAKTKEGPLNERRYLNALTGPNGEEISYFRAGSCCPVKSENGFMGSAMLDNYRVTWEGSKDTLSIYINMYDSGKLKAPKGFGLKK
ncbi:2-dehydro-3-deoxyphosphooctonate aldolase [Olleya sp. YS]|uniref:2-dehydro-3-deoxyphosphooctonate aldolase n=1 Tax=Olleya sp. YS TaxID=3028318 RepID=UPI0024344D59|nr:2-dehydro-3-deoxyphosphooctonate aldolase [Olleya sp. YS]WGD34764.1 2-dehydro-3-deoxyphosphooctonate aldolase [Olleya sp. YS]